MKHKSPHTVAITPPVEVNTQLKDHVQTNDISLLNVCLNQLLKSTRLRSNPTARCTSAAPNCQQGGPRQFPALLPLVNEMNA
eukprot:6490925-Amphidinium_carterae.2